MFVKGKTLSFVATFLALQANKDRYLCIMT